MEQQNIVLLSGGLDSKILLHYLKKKKEVGKNLIPVYIQVNNLDYQHELDSAKLQLKEFDNELQILKIDNIWNDYSQEVILRNLVFLLMGIIKNFKKDTKIVIFYATHRPPTYDNGYYYLDCSPKFVRALNTFFSNIDYNVKIVAPFIKKTLYENIYNAYYDYDLNDYSDVHMCNINKNINCGICNKCIDVKQNLIQFVEMEGVNIKFPIFVKPLDVM